MTLTNQDLVYMAKIRECAMPMAAENVMLEYKTLVSGYNVIRYQIENMNTHEKRIFNSYNEALKDYNLLATTDNRAHGCWRLIALLKEQVY